MSSGKVSVIAREWVTLAEAREKLGKSAKTVERLAAAGHLRSKLEPRDGRKPERMYHAGDLERIGEENVPSEAQPLRKPNAEAALVHQPKPVPPPAQQLTLPALAEMLFALRSEVPLTEKLWLSLEEAQALSGLARNDLLRLCQEKKLTARKSGGWRILRRSLEAFEG